MPPEFEFPGYFLPESQTQTFHSPFRQDETHRLPFREAAKQLKTAGKKIKDQWRAYLDAGLDKEIIYADVTGKPRAVELEEPDGDKTRYQVQPLQCVRDFTGAALDIVRLTKFEEERDSPKAAFITVATSQARPRFDQLVSLMVEDESKKVTKTQFRFIDGSLFAIHQVTQPQVLFPTLSSPNEEQFFSIGFAIVDDEEFLKIEAGYLYDENRGYWYKNFGGSLIRNYGIRMVEGDLEVVEISKDKGIIYTTSPFSLPKAIENIADFEPATAGV